MKFGNTSCKLFCNKQSADSKSQNANSGVNYEWENKEEQGVIYHTIIYSNNYTMIMTFFPQTVWLTLGVLTVIVKGRGARSEVPDGIRRNFRGFVLACAFFVAILILFGWPRRAWTGFVCEFSWFPALQLLRCSFFVVILVLFGVLRCS